MPEKINKEKINKEIYEYFIDYIEKHPNDPKTTEMILLMMKGRFDKLRHYEDHKDRHIELHEAMDELIADYIQHHPDEKEYINMPLSKLMEWSQSQTEKPELLRNKINA